MDVQYGCIEEGGLIRPRASEDTPPWTSSACRHGQPSKMKCVGFVDLTKIVHFEGVQFSLLSHFEILQ
jgi:hypothetical protein